jgi:heme o synthase
VTRAIWATIRLVHPFPAALVVVLSGVLILLAHGGSPGILLLARAMATVAASQVAVGALNDFVDREVDGASGRDKPLATGEVAPGTALMLVAASLVALLPLAASFGVAPFFVFLLATSGGIAYDLWLKPTPAGVAGYAVGFLSLITWIWMIAGQIHPWFIPVYPAGILLLLAAHLSQSLPDIELDRVAGQHGLAVLLGPTLSVRTIVASFAIVATGGLALSVWLRSLPATACILGAVVLQAAGLHTAGDYASSVPARRRLFLFTAPAIALLASGCLASLATTQ